jgi:4-carboxymuconolactone decarboxylase
VSRLTSKSLNDLSPEQRELFDKLSSGRQKVQGANIGGPFDGWLLNAEMGKHITRLGNLFRFRTSVDRRYVELVILVTGQHWQAQFEWYAHEPMAREAGLPEPVIAAIHAGEKPTSDDPGDLAAWCLARELLDTHQVSDVTYAEAVARFGEQGVSELVNLSGYYTMVSMTLNTFQMPLPEGATYPFPQNRKD